MKHGLSKHALYKIWGGMKCRCYKPKTNKYYLYGGKGIKICKAWLNNFMNFYNWSIDNGWQEGLFIDRKDSNKDYKPSNCRWVTITIQNRNLSKRKNTTSKYKGVHKYTFTSKNTNKKYYYFIATITLSKKLKHIGCFKNEQDALNARNNYIIKNNIEGFSIQ